MTTNLTNLTFSRRTEIETIGDALAQRRLRLLYKAIEIICFYGKCARIIMREKYVVPNSVELSALTFKNI